MAPTLILLYKFGPELDRDTVTSLYINYGRSIDNSGFCWGGIQCVSRCYLAATRSELDEAFIA